MVSFVVVVQSLSCVWLFCNPMDYSTPGFPVLHHLPELTQTHVHPIGDAIQPSHPLSSPSLPSVFPSIRVFYNESGLGIRWPKYWSFCFSISPSDEYSGLISFRIDWFDLLAVQGSRKSLLQHHSSKASILWYSAFFIVQGSHPYMTIREIIALTRRTFVGKVFGVFCNHIYFINLNILWEKNRRSYLSAIWFGRSTSWNQDCQKKYQ